MSFNSYNLPDNIMAQETISAASLIAKQLVSNKNLIQNIAIKIKEKNPIAAVTIARGSSDHAANFAKYLIETQLGIVTASSAPSVHTIYNSDLNLENMLVIGISQSGKSPDICHVMQDAREKGAITLALVNTEDSPLANLAEFVIPLRAGEEKAVAATKSYMCTLSALLQFIAIYNSDNLLESALDNLESQLQQTLNIDFTPVIEALLDTMHMFVIARGVCFPIAQEAALKFKETACIQAEPFSSAEVLHGPFALVKSGFSTLQFIQKDEALAGNLELAKKMTDLGAQTIVLYPENIEEKEVKKLTDKQTSKLNIALPASIHPLTDPIMIIQAFYAMVNSLAVKRGFDPDNPDNLKKVTETK